MWLQPTTMLGELDYLPSGEERLSLLFMPILMGYIKKTSKRNNCATNNAFTQSVFPNSIHSAGFRNPYKKPKPQDGTRN